MSQRIAKKIKLKNQKREEKKERRDDKERREGKQNQRNRTERTDMGIRTWSNKTINRVSDVSFTHREGGCYLDMNIIITEMEGKRKKKGERRIAGRKERTSHEAARQSTNQSRE